jgi:hypothetical protein
MTYKTRLKVLVPLAFDKGLLPRTLFLSFSQLDIMRSVRFPANTGVRR